jgi:hypothetical protein
MSEQALVDVAFRWSNRFGGCYSCGLPAAFSSGGFVLCSVCVANECADDGFIERLFDDDE